MSDEKYVIVAGGNVYYPQTQAEMNAVRDLPLYRESDRLSAIMDDTQGMFPYNFDSYDEKYKHNWSTRNTVSELLNFDPGRIHSRNRMVSDWDEEIEQYAQEYGIDSDLLRAVVWRESGVGQIDRFRTRLPKPLGSDTVQPTNIDRDYASLIGLDHGQMSNNSAEAIETAAALLSGIAERLDPDMPPSAVLMNYNFLGSDFARDYGILGEAILEQKPWTLPVDDVTDAIQDYFHIMPISEFENLSPTLTHGIGSLDAASQAQPRNLPPALKRLASTQYEQHQRMDPEPQWDPLPWPGY